MSEATKNGNQTAYPVAVAETGLGDTIDSHYAGDAGLTKREVFAMAMIKGNLAAFHDHDVSDYQDIANDCVMMADALLKELEK